MRVVCAPNAFKGTLTAIQAARAMAEGVRRGLGGRGDPAEVPVADGGDGTLDVLLRGAGESGRAEEVTVTGPLGAPCRARLGWIAPTTAVVEMAEAAGLRLLPPGELRPLEATSRGAGDLVRLALDRGAVRVIAGLGGSASTDGGTGLAAALGVRFVDAAGRDLAPGGGELVRLDRIDASGLDRRVAGALEALVDVASPLHGPRGAAAVFAPQKGATADEVALLEAGLRRLEEVAARDLGVAGLAGLPGAGAAGGTGWGVAALLGAALVPGAARVCDLVGLDAAIRGAALVLTGEGRLDASTWMGKAPAEVAARARRAGVPCAAVAGVVDDAGPLDRAVALAPPVAAEAGHPPSAAETARLITVAAAALAVQAAEAAAIGGPAGDQ